MSYGALFLARSNSTRLEKSDLACSSLGTLPPADDLDQQATRQFPRRLTFETLLAEQQFLTRLLLFRALARLGFLACSKNSSSPPLHPCPRAKRPTASPLGSPFTRSSAKAELGACVRSDSAQTFLESQQVRVVSTHSWRLGFEPKRSWGNVLVTPA